MVKKIRMKAEPQKKVLHPKKHWKKRISLKKKQVRVLFRMKMELKSSVLKGEKCVSGRTCIIGGLMDGMMVLLPYSKLKKPENPTLNPTDLNNPLEAFPETSLTFPPARDLRDVGTGVPDVAGAWGGVDYFA